MNILLIKFRNIGDVLLTGPLASTLRMSNPTPRISVLVKAGTEAMLQGHPHVDEVIVYPERQSGESWLGYLRRVLAWLRALRRRGFDLAINTTEGDRGAILARLCGARRRIGIIKPDGDKTWRRALYTDTRTPPPGRRHTVIRNLALAPDPQSPRYRSVHLTFSEHDRDQVKALLAAQGWDGAAPLVHVHPTSRWFFKCWNDGDVARVIDHLQSERGLRVALTSGPEPRERDKAATIIRLCRRAPIDLSGRLSLKQTAALSSLCALFFGVDTAPMHVAAALEVPVVAVFGPSGAFDWGPWPNGWQGEDTPYPAQSGVQRAGPHTVVQKAWRCVPCGRDGCAGTKRSACLEILTADEIIPWLDQTLRERSLP
ncbi:MAG: putative lipopolysaccharide heptosyltransferase III [Gammaproteobacteria bacterium]|nr:putative lipopolysaccharide heptosyltransferase III [Gammaproteobacteria bacterium]